MTLKQAAQQALNALEDIGDEWGFTSERTLPNRLKAIIALRESLAEQTEKLKSVEEALIWANNEINGWLDHAGGWEPEDHEPIMKALEIIRSL